MLCTPDVARTSDHGISRQAGKVFISTRVPEYHLKLEQSLAYCGFRINPEGIDVISFSDFLLRLLSFPRWTAIEKHNIPILFLPQGAKLTFETSLHTKSLTKWESLQKAEILLDILENRRMTSHFHPIWDVRRQTVFGHECLLRGFEPTGLPVAPALLFTSAAENDLMAALDQQARHIALQTASQFPPAGKLFINFVPSAINDPHNNLESTIDLAEKLGIEPSRVVFEVVETEEIEDWDHLDTILGYYRRCGFQIALDDVGTGYSSLSRLVTLDPDIIKVDISIIREIDRHPLKQSVFKALSHICRDNGIRLLAEGVETQGEFEFVLSEGADLAQGFLWGKPQPTLGGEQFQTA